MANCDRTLHGIGKKYYLIKKGILKSFCLGISHQLEKKNLNEGEENESSRKNESFTCLVY